MVGFRNKTFLLLSSFVVCLFIGGQLSAQCFSNSNVYQYEFKGHKYKIVKEMQDWPTAAVCAATVGGELIRIDSAYENDTLFQILLGAAGVSSNYATVADGGGVAYVWIGANDFGTEGTWVWDGDGDSAGVNFWTGEGAAGNGGGIAQSGLYHKWGGSLGGTPNEPDDFGTGQDAAAMALNGWPGGSGSLGTASEWNDIAHTNSLYYVIEFNCTDKYGLVEESICNGDSFMFAGKMIGFPGVYYDTAALAGGCDSIITLILDIGPDTMVYGVDDTLFATNVHGSSYRWLNCDSSYSEMVGQYSSTFIAGGSGNFAVEVTDSNGCIDTSGCHATVLASIGDYRPALKFDLYPNPTTNTFNVRPKTYTGEYSYEIFDLSGKAVMPKSFGRGKIELGESLRPGIYMVRLGTEDGRVMNKKLIKR